MTELHEKYDESLLAAGFWDIDPTHSNVEFVARHLRSRIRGRFAAFSGTVEIDADVARCAVEVAIRSPSLDTYLGVRDESLRGIEYLDVQRFPALTFRSTGLRDFDGERAFHLDGDLTIRDATRSVALQVAYLGCGRDAWGATRAGFSARTEIDREEFGVTGNVVLETGAFLVGRRVQIELEVEAVLRAEPE